MLRATPIPEVASHTAAVAEHSCNKLLEEPAASPQWRDGGLARNHARRTVRGVDIRHVLHRVGGVER
jgi:hypothetical protein